MYDIYMSYTFRTIIEKDGKFFHGYVPTLLGCHTFDTTIEETQKNLKDAIKVYLESITESSFISRVYL